MKHFWNSPKLLSSLASCLLASSALAGPHDVLQEPEEPMGTLQADQLLEIPNPKRIPPPPPLPPQESLDIDSASGISVSEVTSSIESIGTMALEETVFQENVWQYLVSDEAETLLDALPPHVASRRIQEQLIDLLELSAPAPRYTKTGWLVARSNALAHIGYVKNAQSLLVAIPPSLRDAALNQLLALRTMQSDSAETACALTDEAFTGDDLAEKWQRFHIFCMAVNGDTSKANLAISLKNESGAPYPEWFSSLLESLEYTDTKIQLPDAYLDGIDQAMMLYAGNKRLPKDVALSSLIDNKPDIQLMIGKNTHYDLTNRIEALEALSKRAVAVPLLGDLYTELNSKPADATNRNILKRASAYAQLSEATSSAQAIKRIESMLETFQSIGMISTAYDLLRDPIIALSHSMKRGQGYVSFAPQAYAILMQNQQVSLTDKWLNMMDVRDSNAIITYVTHELTQFAHHGYDEQVSKDAKEMPPFSLPESASKQDLQLLHYFYQMLDAFNQSPPSITQEAVNELLGTSDSEIRHSIISDYAERGNLAGMLLSAASLMGSDELKNVPADLSLEIMTALIELQQYELAKQFAIETVIARF